MCKSLKCYPKEKENSHNCIFIIFSVLPWYNVLKYNNKNCITSDFGDGTSVPSCTMFMCNNDNNDNKIKNRKI